ncbi:hypothetical protein MEW_03444 [Candida albicans P60002]|nr:hypothetical protein MG7_03503 [Candida albicans P34048]KGU30055.1 hypothetical protein MGK_03519 [Candida albicans P57055]KHC35146.1 hypothetical protein MGO_03490 [Candida albicans P76055]KHC35919.1 hypothetical protein MGQ_03498 [Candida albicans P76067]KHC50819.1 hypothetical protein MEW_03444 [Candida albicans P60002]
MAVLCGICQVEQSKYKCPKCSIAYCSLTCYKSEIHTHDYLPTVTDTTSQPPQQQQQQQQTTTTTTTTPGDDRFSKLLQDDQIKYLLNQPSLQFHLLSIIKILIDPTFTPKNSNIEQKLDIANLKLNDLRIGGIEQNELVEEFVQRCLELMN